MCLNRTRKLKGGLFVKRKRGVSMNLQFRSVTEKTFFDIINLKSEEEQEKKFQIFDRMVVFPETGAQV
jgi:hypothetical protein